MKNIKSLSVSLSILVITASIAGCSNNVDAKTTLPTEELSELTSLSVEYKKEDINSSYDTSKASNITLNGDKISVSGSGATAKDSTLTISKAGVYVLKGKLNDGQIVIDAKKTDNVKIVLNGVDINCSNSSAIYSKQSKKTIITIAKDTENTLTDGTNYNFAEGEDEPNATIFSKDDLTINGSGTLTVDGKFKHGIVSKDNLVITGGNININSISNGLRGKDSVSIKDGNFMIKSGSDAIKSNNDKDETKGFISIDNGAFNITSENDGIQAETILQINDGTFNIVTGGGSASNESLNKPTQNFDPSKDTNRNNGENRPNKRPNDGNFDPSKMPSPDGMTPPYGEFNPNDRPDGITDPNKKDTSESDTSSEDTISTKGIKAGTGIIINGGTFNIDSYDDTVHSNKDILINNGKFELSSGDDGIHADNQVIIKDGDINISKSYEGIEGKTLTIDGGKVELNTVDDGINASDPDDTSDGRPGQANESCFIRITGGDILINANGDGIDSNGNLYFDGGNTVVNGTPSGPDAAIDFDGICEVTGGVLAAAGNTSMAQTPGDTSSQNSLAVYYSSMQKAGAKVSINDEKGKTIYSFTPSKQYQFIVISTDKLQKGKAYSLLSGTKKLTDFKVSNTVTSISEDGSEVKRNGNSINGFGRMKRP